MYDPYDHYFKKAKKEGYKARSAFKLDEIDQKFGIFDSHTKTVLDIGCAPGSWLQYTASQLSKKNNAKNGKFPYTIVGFDLKKVDLNMPSVYPYIQDITETEAVDEIIKSHKISEFDVIISDMAPNTIGVKEVDAIRSIVLLEQTLWIYKKYLKPDGKFVIKIFMGPGFDSFVLDLKTHFGAKHIKLFKPKACRNASKETYIVKV